MLGAVLCAAGFVAFAYARPSQPAALPGDAAGAQKERRGKVVSLSSLVERGVSHNAEVKKRTILKEGDVPNLVFLSRSVFKPGHNAPGHSHTDMDEVFFVAHGEGTFVIDGTTHILGAGDTAHMAPGEVHDITNKGTEDLVLVYFAVRSSQPKQPGSVGTTSKTR